MSIESISANTAARTAPAAIGDSLPQRPNVRSTTTAPQGTTAQGLTPARQAEDNSSTNQAQNASGNETALEDAVSKLTDFVSNIRSEISFSIDENSGTRVVKVLDSESKEVIRQIPSEEAILLAQALDKLQGLFVRDKA